MRQLLSQFILDKYRMAEHQGSMPAAGVFVDLSGFSVMTDALARRGDHGAEVLADVMRSIFEPLVEAVYAQGGFVVGFAGDAFTAVFPEDPQRDHSVHRALAAVIAIQESTHVRPRAATEFGEFPISVKAGVGFGEVSWLILNSSSGTHVTYCVRGSAVDAAVAAEECAQPGDIMLDPSTHTALEGMATCEHAASCYRLVEAAGLLPAAVSFAHAAPRFEDILPFYPKAVIEQPLAGEFRQVVNVFIDIPIDPTDEAFITPFMENVFALQERYGGFFLRPEMGDKGFNLLMFWGAPLAHENDIDRALSFLMELRERSHIEFRAGVTYRLAYAGFMGAPLREDYTAYGWGVNLASRLMASAGPGEVWLDREISERASNHFWIEEAGEFPFKGFGRKIKAYVLKGRRKLIELAYHGEFVGREQELGRLLEFLAPLGSGQYAGLMLVKGEAGIGKSRLVHSLELSPALREAPVHWALCQTDEILRESFNPFRGWLMRYFGLTDEQDAEARRRAFDDGLQELAARIPYPDLFAELMRTSSVLAAFLNVEQPGSLYEQLDAKGRYDNTLIALSVVLRVLSLQKPLVLLIEDLQWLDGDSLAFLPYFMRTLVIDPQRRYPVAILLTSRPEGQLPAVEEFARAAQIELGPLSPLNVRLLARGLLGGELSPELLTILEDRSEGNPFFAEQLLRYLSDNRLVARSADGVFKPAERLEASLPSDVRALLVARLDLLARDVREVVQTASVLGRQFESRLLASMLNDDPSLAHKIAQAEAADIWFGLNETEYIFHHALLRDAAYSMQLVARQRQLHARAVAAMEAVYAGELNLHLGELAHHAEKANLAPVARTYLIQASRAAAQAYQNSQAIEYLSRALRFTPPDALAGRFDLIAQRVGLYAILGERANQLADLEELEKLGQSLVDHKRLARVWLMRAGYHSALGDFPRTIHFAERAIALARSLAENEVALEAYTFLTIALLRQSRPRTATQTAWQGLELARARSDRFYEASILNTLGMIAVEEQDATAAQGYLEQALLIATSLRAEGLEVRIMTNLGNTAGFLRGDYSGARRYYEQAIKMVREWGDRQGEGLLASNLAWAAGMQGDFAASRAYNQQALTIAREIGNAYQEAYTLINLGSVASIQGDARVAIESCRLAYDLTQKIGDRKAESWSLLNMGHALLLAEEFEQAREAYERCRQLRLDLDQPGFEMEPVSGLIQAALQMDDMAAALQWTEEILAHLGRGGTLAGAEEPLRIYYTCYEALEKLKDPRSRVLLEEAARLLEAQVSKLPEQSAREMFVNSVPWRRGIRDAWQTTQ